MAGVQGTISTYDLTVGVIVDIEPLIRLLSPTETPLQSARDGDGLTVLSMDTAFEKKIEWLDDEILTPRSSANGAATTSETTLNVATDEGIRFSTGDVILTEANEQVRVTGISTDALTITRAFNSTSGATIADLSVLVNLGAHLAEGSDPEAARALDRTNRHNFSQIFGPTKVHVSGTEQAIRKYGVSTTEFDYQAALRLKEEFIKCEQSLIFGQRLDDSTNKRRQMGGFDFYITTNVNTSTTLTDTVLLDELQSCWDNGGQPNRVLLNGKQKRTASGFDSADIRFARAEPGRGTVVDFFDSDFGRVFFVLHRWLRDQDMFLFNRDQATVKTLRPWQFEMLGKTGDAVQGQLVAEKTLMFEAERWAAKFDSLT